MTIEVPVLATVGIPPQLAAIFTPSPMVNGWPSHDAMHENLVRLFRCQRCAKNCIQLAIKFVCRILDLQKILWKAREALAATAHDVWCLAELADQQAILRPVNIDEFPLVDRIAVASLDHRGEENG